MKLFKDKAGAVFLGVRFPVYLRLAVVMYQVLSTKYSLLADKVLWHVGKRYHRERKTRITKNQYKDSLKKKVTKGVWRMPRLSEAKKGVTSCEKLRGLANTN